MSEVRLVVREADEDWSGTVHGSTAMCAIAALSADPVTLDELRTAMGRFEKPHPKWRFLANLTRSSCDEPYDAGIVVIDLIARLVMAESTYAQPSLEGTIDYHDGTCGTDKAIAFHLADDWLLSNEALTSESIAARRRKERAAQPPRDPRDVVYGRPMLEFIIREIFAAFGRRDDSVLKTPAEQGFRASPLYGILKNIHASWLMTPRDDLGGATPREIAFAGRDHVDRDMNDRVHQWAEFHHCPPGLARSSHAFRFAPFGTHELVKHYDLMRELLWSCWHRLVELSEALNPSHRPDAMTVGDFLTMEVPRLEAFREAWLDSPDPEMHGRAPRAYIKRERARIPETISPAEAIHDPDCPCCQMMAEMPGPIFCGLDSCNFDEDFAFDITHRTKEEWDEQQRDYEDMSRRWAAERAERERLGVSYEAKSDAVWTRSFVNDSGADVPLGIRVFGVGCHLAELNERLRESAGADSAETQQHIDRLNRDFGNLREILQSADLSMANALVEPVLSRFAESLDAAGRFRPEVLSQCEALAGEVKRLLDPPPEDGPTPRFDEEMPF